ncbi:MAG TPA: glycosyl transferase [Burkholderiales bacterium]|jgi:UDP-N-acetylmuramyl pentapeptide phosphotransferase/UDP-N-acetylglucosamine-1-phosphate transferase|nr:glycosyl transferase [Burkholderiales bacterium]
MLGGLGVLSFVVAFVASRLLLSRFAGFALDRPNARSLHQRPVPRTGGIAVLAGTAVAIPFVASALWLPVFVAAALAAVSLADDLRGMPTAVRLALHLAAAALLAWYVLAPMHPIELALLAVAVAWITNLYNFMDGSDGLAGGMSFLGFGAYALAAALAGNAPLALLCTAISMAAAAFLAHNFHPARIFLGDVGSIPLGFLAGGLGLVGWRDDVWPLWFPLLVFGPFIGDATVTLLKRLARREKVWQAHRDHYYQRLVRMGFGHRGTAYIGYALMAGCAAVALLARSQAPLIQWSAFFGAAAALAAAAVWIDLRWARHRRDEC